MRSSITWGSRSPFTTTNRIAVVAGRRLISLDRRISLADVAVRVGDGYYPFAGEIGGMGIIGTGSTGLGGAACVRV